MASPPTEEQLNRPALPPPDGVVPVFINPPNQNVLGIAIVVVCLSLSAVAGFLRVYSRCFVHRRLYMEDAIGLVAFGFYGALAWAIFTFIHSPGIFVHSWDVPVRKEMDGLHAAYFVTFLYTFTMLFAKTAILVEWTRIFVVPSHNIFYKATRVIIVLNVLVYTAFSLLFVFFCLPPEKGWMPWVPGRCFQHGPLELAIASTNLVLDVAMVVLPQRVVWALRMPRHLKIGVSIVFSVSLLAVASAIGRAVLTARLIYTGDVLYELSKMLLLAFAELTAVLLVFCVPAIPSAFSHDGALFSAIAAVLSWMGIWRPTSSTLHSTTSQGRRLKRKKMAGGANTSYLSGDETDTQAFRRLGDDGEDSTEFGGEGRGGGGDRRITHSLEDLGLDRIYTSRSSQQAGIGRAR